MAGAQSQAVLLMLKAQKKLSSSPGWFSSLGGGSNAQLEESGDLYQQAANQFKIEKRFKEAGDAFKSEAECREKLKEPNEAANAWWNASKAYKQGKPNHPELAIDALRHTINHYRASGKTRQAADRQKEIAQIALHDLNNIAMAAESYELAAEWYAQEDAAATANSCYKDAADLRAELGQYMDAISHYELVADNSLTSALTKYSVKEYWLRAGLCALALGDTVLARRQLSAYSSKDVTFTSTREAKFLAALIQEVEDENEEGFTNALIDYDSVAKLDNWKTKVLLDIKNRLREGGVAGAGGYGGGGYGGGGDNGGGFR